MKDAMATCQQSLTWISTNAQGEIMGLEGVWTRTTKEVAYEHLDLTHVNFKAHTLKQWEAIHANLAKVFYYDPPLKDRTMENYVKEHISSARNAWKGVVGQGQCWMPEQMPYPCMGITCPILENSKCSTRIRTNAGDSWPCVESPHTWSTNPIPCNTIKGKHEVMSRCNAPTRLRCFFFFLPK